MSFGAAGWGQFLAVQALVKRLAATGVLGITTAGLALISAADATAQLVLLGVSWLSTANHVTVDSVTGTYATNANLTTILPGDDTIPVVTEGTEIISVTITPKSITNKLRVRFSGFGTTAANTYTFCGAVFQGSTCIDSAFLFPTVANQTLQMVLDGEYTPGVLTVQTIAVRIGPGAAGTVRMNGTTAARFGGGSANCTLVVEEIKA